MNLCDYETIRALLERHGFHFSKALGQNFLIDPAIPQAIADASGADAGCGVLEIGPGIGPLTAELARRAGKVVSIELDDTLLPILRETLAEFPNAEILPGDAMKLDLAALAAERFSGLRPVVCANLPYNITTPLLTRLVQAPCFESITVMIQREVAHRICAAPGDSDCGYFSLFMQYYMKTELLFDVPPDRFFPAPKVTSSVLRCVRRETPAVSVDNEAFFFRVLQGAFLLRRKTLSNSLSSALREQLSKEQILAAIGRSGLPADIRGERLSLDDFAILTRNLKSFVE